MTKLGREIELAFIVKKIVETRLKLFDNVERRHVDSVVRRVDNMKGSRITGGRGRPRKTI